MSNQPTASEIVATLGNMIDRSAMPHGTCILIIGTNEQSTATSVISPWRDAGDRPKSDAVAMSACLGLEDLMINAPADVVRSIVSRGNKLQLLMMEKQLSEAQKKED